jgi:hypothetical protein
MEAMIIRDRVANIITRGAKYVCECGDCGALTYADSPDWADAMAEEHWHENHCDFCSAELERAEAEGVRA